MKRGWIWIGIVVVVGGLAGGIWWFVHQRNATQAGPEILRTATATVGNVDLTVIASGNVAVPAEYDLTFRSAGTVKTVDVQVGDHVEQGQTLATLDDTSLVQAVRQNELSVTQAKLNLQQLQQPPTESQVRLAELSIQQSAQAIQVAETSTQVAQSQALLNNTQAQQMAANAQSAYDKAINTLDSYGLPEAYAAGVTAAYMEAKGNVGITQLQGDYAIQQAQSQRLSAYDQYRTAQQNLATLQAGAKPDQVRSLELALEQALLSLDQSRANLAYASLTSPTAGVVAAVNVQVGAMAAGSAPAVIILDDSTLYVDLLIDEIDIGAVEDGQNVALTLDAYPDAVLTGVVARIAPLPQPTVGTSAYQVRVRLDDTGSVEIREGMTASGTITTSVVSNVLVIPTWAVQTDQTSDQIYTYVVSNGTPNRVTITIGAHNETWTQVTAGVTEGQTVALVSQSVNLLNLQGPPSLGRP